LNGDDEREKSRVKNDVKGMEAVLGVLENNLKESFKMNGKAFESKNHLSSRRSETNASIKRVQACVE
jgi:hypothetical protein